MSGPELVAVLSVGASVIQVVDACNKLIDRIKQYRSNAAFIRLRSQLQLFTSNIKALENTSRKDENLEEEEVLLHEVLAGCKLRIEELDSLVMSLVPGPSSSTLRKTMHAVRTFFKDHRVKAILEDLNDYREVILLHICRKTEQNTRRLLFLFEEQQMARQAHESTRRIEPTGPAVGQDHFPMRLRSHRQRRRGDGISCVSGECTCPCHQRSSRAWLVKSTVRPARCGCSGERYVLRATVLGKSVQLNLGASWANGFSLVCTLKVKNIVREGYQGFQVLRQCLNGKITVEHALLELETLHRCGVIDFEDSTKFGTGYLEELCSKDLDGCSIQSQLRLAKFLTAKEVTWKSVLADGLWGPRGFQPELMRALPPLDNPRLCHRYPDPADQYSYSVFADRWWLRAFTQICKSQLEIGEYMPLHTAVSLGALENVDRYLKTHRQIDLSENFLGHTVLHVAVQWAPILDLLLKSGYSPGINLKNVHGATPLCYALVYGFIDSITILVEAGAEFPSILPEFGRFESSLAHAVSAADEKPLLHLLDCFIRRTPPSRVPTEILAPVVLTSPYAGTWNPKAAEYLISKISTSAEMYPQQYERDGFSLLHFASSSRHARTLLKYPNLDINESSDAEGYTPLMIFSWFLDPTLLQETLAKGARVNEADCRGQTALHCTIKAGFSRKGIPPATLATESCMGMMETTAVLIQAGGDLLQRDNCQCYCSPHGCSPLRALVPALFFTKNSRLHPASFPEKGYHMPYVWIVELFILLQECGKDDVISAYIAELDRFQRTDEIGLTHTCCYSSCHDELKYWPPNERSLSKDPRFVYMYGPWKMEEKSLDNLENDWAEIRAEESELGSLLERDCALFEGHWEDRLVKILARRCAMMDCIETKRRLRGAAYTLKPQKLEQSVGDYMEIMKNGQDYMASAIPEYKHERCMQQREKLSNRLNEEYWKLNQGMDKDYDWDVRNMVEGPCMQSFIFDLDSTISSRIWAWPESC